jgi:small GTP-binding protein
MEDLELYKVVKVVLCGSPGVGKTSILKRLVNDPHDSFKADERSTIGVDFKTISVVSRKTGNAIRFQIWDTAGQERFKAVSSSYFRGSHIFLYVYDVTRRATYDDINDWLMRSDWCKNRKTEQFECLHTPYAKAFMVGNKCDLPAEKKEIPYEEADAFAAMHDMVCFEVSAKNNKNIFMMFQSFADMMDEHLKLEGDDDKILKLNEHTEILFKEQNKCC